MSLRTSGEQDPPVLSWRRCALGVFTALLGFSASVTHVAAHEGHDESGESWPVRLFSEPVAVASLVGAIALGVLGFWFLHGRHDGPRRKRATLLLAAAVVALLAIGIAALGATESSAGISSQSQSEYEGLALDGAAPGLALTDQRGERVELAGLRGQIVLLAFLDPNCTDICPLTALHFRDVHEALGTETAGLRLLAVNVNPEETSVDAVAAASERWGVADLPNWHFLTGDPEELEGVRAAYGALGGVPKDGQPGQVAHTPGVWVIDQTGTQRWYVSIPEAPGFETEWVGPSLGEVLQRHVRDLLDG